MIDTMVLTNCRRRMTNLYLSRIDYKKAYDNDAPLMADEVHCDAWSSTECEADAE